MARQSSILIISVPLPLSALVIVKISICVLDRGVGSSFKAIVMMTCMILFIHSDWMFMAPTDDVRVLIRFLDARRKLQTQAEDFRLCVGQDVTGQDDEDELSISIISFATITKRVEAKVEFGFLFLVTVHNISPNVFSINTVKPSKKLADLTDSRTPLLQRSATFLVGDVVRFASVKQGVTLALYTVCNIKMIVTPHFLSNLAHIST